MRWFFCGRKICIYQKFVVPLQPIYKNTLQYEKDLPYSIYPGGASLRV